MGMARRHGQHARAVVPSPRRICAPAAYLTLYGRATGVSGVKLPHTGRSFSKEIEISFAVQLRPSLCAHSVAAQDVTVAPVGVGACSGFAMIPPGAVGDFVRRQLQQAPYLSQLQQLRAP